jgi:hypothetical protein
MTDKLSRRDFLKIMAGGVGTIFGVEFLRKSLFQDKDSEYSYFYGTPEELFEYNPEKLNCTDLNQITFSYLKEWELENKEIIYGEKLRYNDLCEGLKNSDIIVFGEYHGFNPEKIEAVGDVLKYCNKKGTKIDKIGVEAFEHDVEVTSVGYKDIITFANNNKIPIVGIEPEERDNNTWHGGKIRFKSLTEWMLSETKNGNRIIIYIDDGHTSDFGIGKTDELLKYEVPYNIKDTYIENGYKPIIFHIRDKPLLAKLTDEYFEKIYGKVKEREKFLKEADVLWKSIVKPWETDNYFIKINEDEFYYIISDHQFPYTTPKKSLWVEKQYRDS